MAALCLLYPPMVSSRSVSRSLTDNGYSCADGALSGPEDQAVVFVGLLH